MTERGAAPGNNLLCLTHLMNNLIILRYQHQMTAKEIFYVLIATWGQFDCINQPELPCVGQRRELIFHPIFWLIEHQYKEASNETPPIIKAMKFSSI